MATLPIPAQDRSEAGRARIRPLAAALADSAAWRALARDSIVPNVFHDPAMLAAAAGRIAPADWLVAEVSDSDGRLDALAVLRAARVAPMIGPRFADGFWSHFGPRGTVLLRRGAPNAAGRLLDAIAEIAPVVRFGYMALDDAVGMALVEAAEARGGRAVTLGVHERAMLDLAASIEVALGPGLKGRRLRELGRQDRRLYEAGSVRHMVAATPAEIADALKAFAVLEHAGWKGRAGTSLAAVPERLAFARSLAAALAAEDRIRIDRLLLDGRTIAGLITLTAGDAGFLWKVAYDESLAPFSPGVQLVYRVTDAFRADGRLATIDSLATPSHPMMDRLWAGRLRIGTLVLATSAGAVRAAERVAWLQERVDAARAGARTVRDALTRS